MYAISRILKASGICGFSISASETTARGGA
jgi:hypothetical protein